MTNTPAKSSLVEIHKDILIDPHKKRCGHKRESAYAAEKKIEHAHAESGGRCQLKTTYERRRLQRMKM